MPKVNLEDILSIIEEKPFTFLLLFFGALFGYFLPGGLDYFFQIDFSKLLLDPNAMVGWMLGLPVAIFIEAISTLIMAIVGGIIGLIIDLIRNSGIER